MSTKGSQPTAVPAEKLTAFEEQQLKYLKTQYHSATPKVRYAFHQYLHELDQLD